MLVKDSPTHKLISKFRTQLRESVGSSVVLTAEQEPEQEQQVMMRVWSEG